MSEHILPGEWVSTIVSVRGRDWCQELRRVLPNRRWRGLSKRAAPGSIERRPRRGRQRQRPCVETWGLLFFSPEYSINRSRSAGPGKLCRGHFTDGLLQL